MPAIVVITHHDDVPVFTSETEDGLVSPYMLGPIIVELASRGHRVTIAKGVPSQTVAADLAILHVDFTLVPPEYLAFAASFPICLNGKVGTIAKRAVADVLRALPRLFRLRTRGGKRAAHRSLAGGSIGRVGQRSGGSA